MLVVLPRTVDEKRPHVSLTDACKRGEHPFSVEVHATETTGHLDIWGPDGPMTTLAPGETGVFDFTPVEDGGAQRGVWARRK